MPHIYWSDNQSNLVTHCGWEQMLSNEKISLLIGQTKFKQAKDKHSCKQVIRKSPLLARREHNRYFSVKKVNHTKDPKLTLCVLELTSCAITILG